MSFLTRYFCANEIGQQTGIKSNHKIIVNQEYISIQLNHFYYTKS